MTRVMLGIAALVIVGIAVAFSRPKTLNRESEASSDFKIETAARNPWTHLKLNRDSDQFQFAVVSDRTGGHRAKIFSKAVHQLNLLQPEFVVSVGDLVEGYTEKLEQIQKEWNEFDSFATKLEMPFFYIPGNHDLTNPVQAEQWGIRYGKSYYSFVYKNVLFLALNSEDTKGANITRKQSEVVQKTLEANPNVRWTLVFLHKPLWMAPDLQANGWGAVEQLLAGRKYTVFCGHVHRYQKFVRNGMNYYQLATTGGGSRLRGPEYGEFDHFTWITMKKDGPLIANVLLDGVLPENLKLPESEEPGNAQYEAFKAIAMHPTSIRVSLDGKPISGAVVSLHGRLSPTSNERMVADGLSNSEGWVALSTLKSNDGVPAGEYRVTVFRSKNGGYYDGEYGEKSVLPTRFADKETSGLKVVVVAGKNQIDLDLRSK